MTRDCAQSTHLKWPGEEEEVVVVLRVHPQAPLVARQVFVVVRLAALQYQHVNAGADYLRPPTDIAQT